MPTYADIRDYFDHAFASNPSFYLDIDELHELGRAVAVDRTGIDPRLLTRARFLLDGSRDDRHICFNTEAVAFGILDTKYFDEAIATRGRIHKFMTEHGFDEYNPDTDTGHYEIQYQHKNAHILATHELTDRVNAYHEITSASEGRVNNVYLFGRNVCRDLFFVSQETFRDILSRCNRTRDIARCNNIVAQVISIYTHANEESSYALHRAEIYENDNLLNARVAVRSQRTFNVGSQTNLSYNTNYENANAAVLTNGTPRETDPLLPRGAAATTEQAIGSRVDEILQNARNEIETLYQLYCRRFAAIANPSAQLDIPGHASEYSSDHSGECLTEQDFKYSSGNDFECSDENQDDGYDGDDQDVSDCESEYPPTQKNECLVM